MATGRNAASRLKIAIPLTGSIFLVEFAGGLWSSSLALLSDSLHVLFDTTALALSLGAIVLSFRPPTDRHSYGLHRMEILAALINGLVLFACLRVDPRGILREVSLPPGRPHPGDACDRGPADLR